MEKMIESFYTGKKIDSVDDLCLILGITNSQLVSILGSINSYYHANRPIIKKDGGIRLTFRVSNPLRSVQSIILSRIINKVIFSHALFGVGKDSSRKHDNIANSLVHSYAKTMIQEDIHHFFDHINQNHVYSIWNGFFGFSPEVSQILTNLSIFQNKIPQGSKTGSPLAALVFWNQEPEFISNLLSKGCIYTRYIDNLTISSKQKLSKIEIKNISHDLKTIIYDYGFSLNAKDHKISRSSNRINITGVNPYLGSPKISKEKVNKIRATVHQFCLNCQKQNSMDELQKEYRSLHGKLTYFSNFNKTAAKKYLQQIDNAFKLSTQPNQLSTK
ncbi:MAG: reverse transcriptase family protein [Anaerolineaceae bacterium]|nr:reverse transcriptase family protein [Anaerolineaceae bacterium]